MRQVSSQNLPHFNKSQLKSTSLELMKHVGWLVLGIAILAAIISSFETFRSALEAWYSSKSLAHSANVSVSTAMLVLVALIAGSWSVGKAFVHVIALVFRNSKKTHAPN
jgi:hypothetical protein